MEEMYNKIWLLFLDKKRETLVKMKNFYQKSLYYDEMPEIQEVCATMNLYIQML